MAAGWWLVALAIGLYLGRPERAADGVRDALARARTATSLPQETPTRIALGRLWPIGAIGLIGGVLGVFFPGVATVGAGYALLVALAWRSHEAAVLGVEQRDGTKFYVVPNSALQPGGAGAGAGAAHRPAAARRPEPRAYLISFLNSRQPRVLATSAAVSQARRAVATA